MQGRPFCDRIFRPIVAGVLAFTDRLSFLIYRGFGLRVLWGRFTNVNPEIRAARWT